jgi:predicted metal-dependent hydrolase
LFPREELRLRPSGVGRLAALAAVARPALTERERRRAEDREALDLLRARAAELAGRFGLRCRALEAERDGVVEHYGICYEDGLIRIRLRHARTGRLLKESSLVDTLCHELAHLRHMNHGLRFRRLYQRILAAARELGHYRPGPGDVVLPRQGSLFDGRGCGTAD